MMYALRSRSYNKYWTGEFNESGHFELSYNSFDAKTFGSVQALIMTLINKVNDNHHPHSLSNWSFNIVELEEVPPPDPVYRVKRVLGEGEEDY